MWMEKLDNGKFKYREKYLDELTDQYKTVSTTMTSDSRQAENKAKRILLNKIDKKKINTVNTSKMTFEEVAYEWLSQYNTGKGSTFSSTSYGVDSLIKYHMVDEKKYLIHKIHHNTLQDVFDRMVREKKLSQNYVSQLRGIIYHIFKYAMKKEYISDLSPISLTSVPKTIVTLKQYEKGKELNFLEQDELDHVLAVCDKYNPSYANVFEVQAYTGMRISECLSLLEDDVEIVNGQPTIHVKSTFDSSARSPTKGERTPPKSDKGYRDVEISHRIYDLIQDRINSNKYLPATSKHHGYIFITRNRTPYSVGALNDFLRARKNEFNLPNKRITTHIFRHTQVCLLAEQGVPLYAIMDRIGHADKSTTERIYLHVTKNVKEKVLDVINKM